MTAPSKRIPIERLIKVCQKASKIVLESGSKWTPQGATYLIYTTFVEALHLPITRATCWNGSCAKIFYPDMTGKCTHWRPTPKCPWCGQCECNSPHPHRYDIPTQEEAAGDPLETEETGGNLFGGEEQVDIRDQFDRDTSDILGRGTNGSKKGL